MSSVKAAEHKMLKFLQSEMNITFQGPQTSLSAARIPYISFALRSTTVKPLLDDFKAGVLRIKSFAHMFLVERALKVGEDVLYICEYRNPPKIIEALCTADDEWFEPPGPEKGMERVDAERTYILHFRAAFYAIPKDDAKVKELCTRINSI